MVLMPSAPTMVDARNAMLAADMARFGGANQDLLWQAFAGRGYGQQAAATSPSDSDPTPDFSSPRHDNATLVFDAVAKDGSSVPVGADIFVATTGAGDPDRRHRPRDDRAQPRSDGADRALGRVREERALQRLQLRRQRPGLRPRPLQGGRAQAR
jgi:hypothetical protein